jgi:hypothetical protein
MAVLIKSLTSTESLHNNLHSSEHTFLNQFYLKLETKNDNFI